MDQSSHAKLILAMWNQQFLHGNFAKDGSLDGTNKLGEPRWAFYNRNVTFTPGSATSTFSRQDSDLPLSMSWPAHCRLGGQYAAQPL
jgi:hypothetical protein